MLRLFGPDGEGGDGEDGAAGHVGAQQLPGQSFAGHEHRSVSALYTPALIDSLAKQGHEESFIEKNFYYFFLM